MKKLFIVLTLILYGCIPKVNEPTYDIDQDVYSKGGKDSVRTTVYFFEKSPVFGINIYDKKNRLSNKLSDSLEAVKFISTHKKYK